MEITVIRWDMNRFLAYAFKLLRDVNGRKGRFVHNVRGIVQMAKSVIAVDIGIILWRCRRAPDLFSRGEYKIINTWLGLSYPRPNNPRFVEYLPFRKIFY